MIAPAKQHLERMLTGIELAQAVDTQQGGKKQRVNAAQKRRVAMMQQGKVIAGVRLRMGCDRLPELDHHRGKGMVLVEPKGTQMHAHTCDMGCDPYDLCARGNRLIAVNVHFCPQQNQ